MKRGLRASAKSIEPGQPVRAWAKAFVCQKASSTLTLSQTTILDSSKHKKFADDNSKFDQSSRMFSKRVENTVGKGEIARYEQFLLFPHCFRKTCTADP